MRMRASTAAATRVQIAEAGRATSTWYTWRGPWLRPPPFEIPQQLRELAERNVEQARTAYGQFMDAMVQATGMWANAMPANAMTSGFKTVQDRAIKFAKQNAEAGFSLATELASAKDITDVLAIQSRYAQTQMQAYALQAQELGRLMAEATQSSMQPRG